MAVEEKPYLSDAINYKEEIEPYRYITLYSGVGSGKNTFINKIISGDAERGIPKKTVLLITSRRAKVDELLTDDEIDATGKIGRWGNIHREMNGSDDPEYYSEYARIIKCDSGEHRVYQQSVICTNAFIEKFFQYCYVPSNVVTHLWELFDLIVVDEVHSLVLDATYQSAPFYVKMLINEVLRRHSLADENEAKPEEERDPHVRRPLCERVILMTGTSGPIEILPNPEKNATVLDKMETCKNVVPKNVWFIKMENTRERIAEQIAAGERVVYFSNNVLLPSDFDKKNRIPTERITASFSKEEKRSAIKKDEKHKSVYENMIETEKSIAESGHIPSNFSLLLTTSRNKEGINIVDKDVQHIYVETHNLADIQQMAGRVRCGVENLYIIIDAPDHHLDDWELDRWFTMDHITSGKESADGDEMADDLAANAYMKYLCKKNKVDLFDNRNAESTVYSNKELGKFVTYVHDKFPFARYDYLRNSFCLYDLRFIGILYQMVQTIAFTSASKDSFKLNERLEEVFPTSTIHPYIDRIELIRDHLLDALKDDPRRTFTADEEKQLLSELNEIWSKDPQEHYSEIGYFLSKIGYERRRASKDRSRPSYDKFRYLKKPRDEFPGTAY